MLGISVGIVCGISPSAVALPFALLNLIYSSSLAISVIVLSISGAYQENLNSLLFGDILALQVTDLIVGGVMNRSVWNGVLVCNAVAQCLFTSNLEKL